MGGNNQNRAIHLERNRIFGNGNSACNGGITIASGNPDTLLVNNLIHSNGRNGEPPHALSRTRWVGTPTSPTTAAATY